MAKQVRQFRYYGEGDARNYPSLISAQELVRGNIFKTSMPSSHLGIQSLPGTSFYLNGNVAMREIILGHTGIFELDLGNDLSIDTLQFSMESLERINRNDNAALFIDLIYEGGTMS